MLLFDIYADSSVAYGFLIEYGAANNTPGTFTKARFTPKEKADYAVLGESLLEKSAFWEQQAQDCKQATAGEPAGDPTRATCNMDNYLMVLTGAAGLYNKSLAGDPPDPNFTLIAQPTPPVLHLFSPGPTWTSAQLAVYNAWKNTVSTLDQLIGLTQATITSVNRAEGAFEAGDSYWEQQQVTAINRYADQAAFQLQLLLREQAQLAAAWPASGLPATTITTAQATQFSTAIATSGLPSDVEQQLTSLGVDSEGLATISKGWSSFAPSTISGDVAHSFDSLIGPMQQLSQLVIGDRNGDGVVNCADLAIVKASFGKKTGQAGFDPRADVNGDGVVNILDLAAVAKALPAGTTCP